MGLGFSLSFLDILVGAYIRGGPSFMMVKRRELEGTGMGWGPTIPFMNTP